VWRVEFDTSYRLLPSLPQAAEESGRCGQCRSHHYPVGRHGVRANLCREDYKASSRLTASGNLEPALAYIKSFRRANQALLDSNQAPYSRVALNPDR
jgi:hypothetical protein